MVADDTHPVTSGARGADGDVPAQRKSEQGRHDTQRHKPQRTMARKQAGSVGAQVGVCSLGQRVGNAHKNMRSCQHHLSHHSNTTLLTTATTPTATPPTATPTTTIAAASVASAHTPSNGAHGARGGCRCRGPAGTTRGGCTHAARRGTSQGELAHWRAKITGHSHKRTNTISVKAASAAAPAAAAPAPAVPAKRRWKHSGGGGEAPGLQARTWASASVRVGDRGPRWANKPSGAQRARHRSAAAEPSSPAAGAGRG